MLLEKGLAKIHGSYGALHATAPAHTSAAEYVSERVGTTLETLSGCPLTVSILQKTQQQQQQQHQQQQQQQQGQTNETVNATTTASAPASAPASASASEERVWRRLLHACQHGHLACAIGM
jgi:hypothetical protein